MFCVFPFRRFCCWRACYTDLPFLTLGVIAYHVSDQPLHQSWTSMSVLVILGWKYTLAASRAAPWWVTLRYAPRAVLMLEKDGTDRRTDGRTPDRYITLTARRGHRNKLRRMLKAGWTRSLPVSLSIRIVYGVRYESFTRLSRSRREIARSPLLSPTAGTAHVLAATASQRCLYSCRLSSTNIWT